MLSHLNIMLMVCVVCCTGALSGATIAQERPMERQDGVRRHDGGGGMVGGAISIFGDTIIREMNKPQDAQQTTTKSRSSDVKTTRSKRPTRTTTNASSHDRATKVKRVAKKGDGDKDKGKGGNPNAPPPPTPIKDDPNGGFTVDGGVVHRGTGMTRGRKAIFCWVTTTDKKKCEQFKEFQFVTISVKTKWGDGPEQDANADINKLFPKGIEAGTTAKFTPGALNADDYPDRNDNPDKKASMTDAGGKEVKAGPYRPDSIPGVKDGSGLIDAPSWVGYAPKIFDGIAPKDVKKLPSNKTQPSKPEDMELGTMKFLQHFRTYVYCMKPFKCLGYFEWDYDETVTFLVTWKETEASLGSKVGMGTGSTGGKKKTQAELDKEETERPKNWEASFARKSTVDGPKGFTGWKDPC